MYTVNRYNTKMNNTNLQRPLMECRIIKYYRIIRVIFLRTEQTEAITSMNTMILRIEIS